MPKYNNTNITAKLGVNYIRSIVEESGSIFHKIEQENDLGIDGFIEFIENGIPTCKSIAVQIKSGNSYYNRDTQECVIPVGSHYEYWINYPLPIYGVVYVHDLKNGFWVDIKKYFQWSGKVSVIKYSINRVNNFDLIDFNRIFIPNVLKKTPIIPFEEALSFFNSKITSEFITGLSVLFRKYINNKETWDAFIYYLIKNETINIPQSLIYYIAHIPWHPDIAYSGEHIDSKIESYVLSMINSFDKGMVLKLLSMIDDEVGVCRGSLGQCVEAILSKVSEIDKYLEEIIVDKDVSYEISRYAALILTYYIGEKALPIIIEGNNLKKLDLSDFIEYIIENKEINPYS